jgi:hypothetical protein
MRATVHSRILRSNIDRAETARCLPDLLRTAYRPMPKASQKMRYLPHGPQLRKTEAELRQRVRTLAERVHELEVRQETSDQLDALLRIVPLSALKALAANRQAPWPDEIQPVDSATPVVISPAEEEQMDADLGTPVSERQSRAMFLTPEE